MTKWLFINKKQLQQCIVNINILRGYFLKNKLIEHVQHQTTMEEEGLMKHFNSVQKRNQKIAESLKSDCFIFNNDLPKIPTNILKNLAEIHDVLEEAVDEHYKDNIYEEVFDPDVHMERPDVEQKWTSDDKVLFESACKKLNVTLRRSKILYENKIKHLKKYFPNKTNKDIVEYYYKCYQPAAKMGAKKTNEQKYYLREKPDSLKRPTKRRKRKLPASKEGSDTKRIKKETG